MQDKIPFYEISDPYQLFYKKNTTAYPVGAHTHNAAELYLTLSDLPDVLLNDTVSRIPRGTLILIPPFCVHQLYHEKDVCYERYILNLDINWLENVLMSAQQELTSYLKQPDSPLILSLDDTQLNNLTQIMTELIPVLENPSIEIISKFFTLLSTLDAIIQSANLNITQPATLISKSQKTVNEIIAFINEHLEENINLDDISSHFYLNKDYLSRLFMKHTHTSLGRYITIQRISKAQEHLRNGMTVSQVSEKMGFSSYAYFFKVFKKMTGISPSQYRLLH